MSASKKDRFVLTIPKIDHCDSGIVRISPEHYLKVLEIKQCTGIPISKIVEQCIDFSLERLIIRKEETK